MSRILYLQRLDVSSAFPDHAMEDGKVVSSDAVLLGAIAKRFAEVTRVSTRYLKFASGIRAQITEDHFVLEIPLHLKDSIGRTCILLVLSEEFPTLDDAVQMGQLITGDILVFLCSLDEVNIYPPENHIELTQNVTVALEKIVSANEVPREEKCGGLQPFGSPMMGTGNRQNPKLLPQLRAGVKRVFALLRQCQCRSNKPQPDQPPPEE